MEMLKTALAKFPRAKRAVEIASDYRFHGDMLRSNKFAQNGEDMLLLQMLQERGARGPYVDVGASHPFRLSNTYLLYRNGFRGVCVDPLPRYVHRHKWWRPKDTFVSSAVGDIPAVLPLYVFVPDVLSTMDKAVADSYVSGGRNLERTIEVPVRRLDDILEGAQVQGPVSLLSVDVEGHEMDVLRSLSFGKWKPEVVCLEVVTADGGVSHDASNHVIAQGYTLAKSTEHNQIFVRSAT